MRAHLAPLFVAVFIGAAAFAGTAGPVAADDLSPDTATTTYELVPSKGIVQVTVDIRVENHIPSTTDYVPCIQYQWDPYWGLTPYSTTCPKTTNYYVNESAVWVEDAAQSLHASADSGSVSLSLVKKQSGFRLMKVKFKNLFNGQVRRIHVSYTLPGGKPRSTNLMRAGAAYAAFCATGNGLDSGRVRVVVPAAFKFDTVGGPATSSTSGAKVVYDSGTVADPINYYLCLSGTNEAALKQTTITAADGRSFVIESWPEDTAWQGAIQTQLAASIQGLETLIGASLPGSGSVHVREVAALDLGDYAGTYDPESQVAEVAEDAIGTDTLPHELAHMWFNRGFLADTWLDEGYAEWSARAVDPAGLPTCTDPGAYPGSGGPSLGRWTSLSAKATEQDKAVVGYNYDAACYIVTDAAASVGTDGMRQALEYLMAGRIPYLEQSTERQSASAISWRTWLDAVDEESGSSPLDPDHIQALLARFGIASDPAQLTARSVAREQYHQLKTATADWRLPLFLGRAMADWRFSDATAAMTATLATRRAAEQVAAALPSVDAVNGPVKALVEKAGSLADLQAAASTATAQLDAARAVAAAVRAADSATGPLDLVGLLGTDVRGQEAAAVAAVATAHSDLAQAAAAQLGDEAKGASTTGALRLAAVLGILGFFALAAFAIRRRRSRSTSLAFGGTTPSGVPEEMAAESTGLAQAVEVASAGDIETAATAAVLDGPRAVPDEPQA
jgi:hypothetical protein